MDSTSPKALRRALILLTPTLLLAGLVVVSLRGGPNTTTTRTFEPPLSAGPGWDGLSSVPLSPRAGPTLAWTGQELVVFGGNATSEREGLQPLADGASYDPSDGSWAEIPSAPFDAPPLGPTTVWMGSELLVVATLCSTENGAATDDSANCSPGTLAAATFDPASRSWERVPLPDELGTDKKPGFYSARGWTGQEAILQVGGSLWAYSPGAKRWSVLPPAPFALTPESVCVSESRITAVTFTDQLDQRSVPAPPPGQEAELPDVKPGQRADILATTINADERTWSEPVSSGDYLAPTLLTSVCAPGGTLVLPGGSDKSVSLLFDSRALGWTSVPPPPVYIETAAATTVARDTTEIFGLQGSVAFVDANRSWSAINSSSSEPPLQAVWVGDPTVLLLGSDGTGRIRLVLVSRG